MQYRRTRRTARRIAPVLAAAALVRAGFINAPVASADQPWDGMVGYGGDKFGGSSLDSGRWDTKRDCCGEINGGFQEKDPSPAGDQPGPPRLRRLPAPPVEVRHQPAHRLVRGRALRPPGRRRHHGHAVCPRGLWRLRLGHPLQGAPSAAGSWLSSIVGVVSQPYTHAYGMSKYAIRALSASLRQERRLDKAKGVHVCTVLPATIDTPLFEHAANYTGRKALAMPPVYSPERVARTIVDLVRVPRREVVVGPMGRSMVLESRIMPGVVERMMARQVDKTHLSRKEPAPAGHGNLHVPAPGTGAAHGGWGGRRRTAMRRLTAATVLRCAAAGVARRVRTH
ncbi:hypothetical protein [Streptomyces flavidovirens]|uniref:Uncharacterized protein n=1 Tax=Streptomyces flavidovirens TaxID=67298 RepID=A0ABW6RMK5_9ACTN